MSILKLWMVLAMGFVSFNCQTTGSVNDTEVQVGTLDPHSFSQPQVARVVHLELDLEVDFKKNQLAGSATWDIQGEGATEIIFDTRGLVIQKITAMSSAGVASDAKFKLGKEVTLLGRPLIVSLLPDTRRVKIEYQTTAQSEALLWLTKEQTTSKHLPFLFTQGQPIYARTWIPCQDSPGIRVTYNARIKVPPGHMALMSATNERQKSADGIYNFRMELPVPAYLIALAVGDLSFESISKRAGVYGEPDMTDAAFIEFEGIEQIIQAAESMFGGYTWGRFDLLVLPPSFPYGGMENPRLTFVTPTIIAGDRSLISLVAHELAHSWSGNLVTNASWNDFWLNEGVTSYVERRIMEVVYGRDFADMIAVLGYQDLIEDLELLGKNSPLTRLKLDLRGLDPDAASTDIAYEKGAHFLTLLEQKAGRAQFDEFLNLYFKTFQFQSVTTEQFLEFLKIHLIDRYQLEVDVQNWVYGTGLPDDCPIAISTRFQEVDTMIAKIKSGEREVGSAIRNWSALEWVHFLRNLPRNLDNSTMKRLDILYKLTESGNAEIKAVWFELAIANGYSEHIGPDIEAFLVNVGRRRFLIPIYRALIQRGQKEFAQSIFNKARPNYHAVSAGSVEKLFE